MKQLAFALSAVLLTACMTTPDATKPAADATEQKVVSEISSELLQRLSILLANNPDLREAYLVLDPGGGDYVLVPTFDGAPNMTSLYEALELFKEYVPGSQLNLALLTPRSIKQSFGQAEPFYVRVHSSQNCITTTPTRQKRLAMLSAARCNSVQLERWVP
ncbi:enhanced serine sensitivity protein SseB C-terminal domain-containing protein [Cognatiluteimonas weifangensis]|uniref:enhanced serine sensitivity protein SseB C-terminal domain-containing protein n=1 Tax=Cognatiluteimonas weifangensis TaxID=2303539 RepID=UPI0011C0E713|nr:enhanced serine sensitivity protein SseB C-terminal domain-containing protein [Luteimonas weifangensis]